MIKILALSSVAVAALASTPALAQGIPSGPRIEIFAGYDKMMTRGRSFTESVDACVDYYCEETVDSISYGFAKSRDEAFVYGIGAGYDFAMGGNFALGIDIEASNTSVETTEGFAASLFDPDSPVFHDDGDDLLLRDFEFPPSVRHQGLN